MGERVKMTEFAYYFSRFIAEAPPLRAVVTLGGFSGQGSYQGMASAMPGAPKRNGLQPGQRLKACSKGHTRVRHG